MPDSQDLIKRFVAQVGNLIDVRNKTLESSLKIYIDKSVKDNINKAIKASEERQNKRLQAAVQIISTTTKAKYRLQKEN